MARPIKNSVDYFPHDSDMRNHKKVKAIRSRFGVNGYAIWSFLLEYLSGSDGNVFPYSDLEFELMSGDFGVPATEIRSVVDYCISLEMLFVKDGFVNSESLDERLAPVYLKRGKAKELSEKQRRDKGKFINSNTESSGVSVTEIPQIRLNEIKSDKIKKTKPLRAYEIPFMDDSIEMASWIEWETYRREIQKKITPSTAKQQFKFLGGRAGPEIVAIINQSILNGWTGLFELKKTTNGEHRGLITKTVRRADAIIEQPEEYGDFRSY